MHTRNHADLYDLSEPPCVHARSKERGRTRAWRVHTWLERLNPGSKHGKLYVGTLSHDHVGVLGLGPGAGGGGGGGGGAGGGYLEWNA